MRHIGGYFSLLVICILVVILRTEAEQNLYWNIPWDKIKNAGYEHLDSYSVASDPNSPDNKKENRMLPIILKKNEPLNLPLECVFKGYNEATSKGNPDCSTSNLEDRTACWWNLDKHNASHATWSTTISLTENDFGQQNVACIYWQRGTAINLTLEIYAQFEEPEQRDLQCDGAPAIHYHGGGKNQSDFIFGELKNQALKLHKEALFIDGPENNFTICETKSSISPLAVAFIIVAVVVVGVALALASFKEKLCSFA